MKHLFPDYIYKSVTDIDFTLLYQKGIRGIIFDIDNTLVPYNQPDATQKEIDIIDRAKKAGLMVAFASNNSQDRVKKFNDKFGLFAIHRANKPFIHSFKKIAENMELSHKSIAVIGDQIFTDVYGANRCNMVSVLVNPIESKENWFFKIKRGFEKLIIKKMDKRRK